MLETILNLLGAGGAGGALGLLGSMGKSWIDQRAKDKERAHELLVLQDERENMKLEAALAIKQTESEFAGRANIANIEAQMARDISDAEALTNSYKNDRAMYAGNIEEISGTWANLAGFFLAMVDVVRGLMRPTITASLLIIEFILAYKLLAMVNELNGLTGEAALTLLTAIIHSLLFLTATAVTWWFGSRKTQH